MTLLRYALFAITLTAFFLTADAAAQPLPGSAEPSRIITIQPPSLPPTPEAVIPEITEAAPQQAPAGAEDITFTLTRLNFTPSRIFSEAELQGRVKKHIGKTVSMKQLFDIASDITKAYHNKGYILSKAILPPQEVESGVVTISLIEGYISRVRTEGSYESHKAIDNIVANITRERPFNIRTLERAMLLLGDMPGLSARSVLEPLSPEERKDPAAIGLLLLLESESWPVHAGRLALNNHGSKYIGPWQAEGQVDVQNFLNLYYGVTTVSVTTALPASELAHASIRQRIPLRYPGATLSGNFSYSNSAPGYTLKPSEVKSDTWSGGLTLSKNIVRSRSKNLSIDGTLDYKNIETTFVGLPFYNDRIRALRASLNGDIVDSWGGGNMASVTVSRGLDVLGARETGSVGLSRVEGRSDFTKYEINAARLQNIFRGFSAYFSLKGQYSADPLLSSEEFGFGGYSGGRAYDSSEISGDKGISGVIELRHANGKNFHGLRYEPYAFYDIGKVWNLDTGGENTSLAAAGLGVRFNYNEKTTGDLVFALPLTKKPDAPDIDKGMRPAILFTLARKFD